MPNSKNSKVKFSIGNSNSIELLNSSSLSESNNTVSTQNVNDTSIAEVVTNKSEKNDTEKQKNLSLQLSRSVSSSEQSPDSKHENDLSRLNLILLKREIIYLSLLW